MTIIALLAVLGWLVPAGFTAAGQKRSLESAVSSPQELTRRFLDAVAENDLEAARRLAITRDEFDRYVWPELPAADPARNTPAEFVWNQTNIRSRSKLETALSHLGGQRFELDDLQFTGGVTQYETYRLHRNSLLFLKDEEGETVILRLFGSVLELDGQFKIYSFNYD